MLMIDALRNADTAQEVCFLLTSYVETLAFYDARCHLPLAVKQLPVRGIEDIAERLAGLQAAQRPENVRSMAHEETAMLEEAIHLFDTAVNRLRDLDAAGTAHDLYDRRISPRPAGVLRV